MFELVENQPQNAVIKVIGVGGCGGNVVKYMISNPIEGVDLISANTDAKALIDVQAGTVLKIGNATTKGLGAGSNPEVGRQAAMEDRERIAEVLRGTDIVFIAAGMGGGTGTGGAPIVAEIAKDLGILTVAVVTKPFRHELRRRGAIALEGIEELAPHVDSLITIPNEKIESVLGRDIKFTDALNEANKVLYNAVQGIAELITKPGMISVDFADVRSVMGEMGLAMMGTASAKGENRAVEAARAAISSPLLEDVDLRGARGILVNVTASDSLTSGEFYDIGDIVAEFASDDALVIPGAAIDPEMGDEIRVTIVATGLSSSKQAEAEKTANVQRTRPRAEAPVLRNAITPEKNNQIDYDVYDRPTISRNAGKVEKNKGDMEFLDIPAFLRRQAD